MDSTPGNPFDKGKREAEDAIDMEVVSAKKQRVGDKASEIKTDIIAVEENVQADTSYSQPDHCIKVNVSAEDGHVASVLEDKSNVLEEDVGAAEKKSAVPVEGHIAAALNKDESNHDSHSSFREETSLDEDVVATITAPATVIEEDPPRKNDKSNKGSDCSSKCETILDEDVTGANLSPSAPSMLIWVAPVQKKDDHHFDEFEYAHENDTDYNVATAKEAAAAPSEKGPVVAWGKKDESGSDNEIFDEVSLESVPKKKEDETNDELEIDDDTSSSDDDIQTPATPTEQTIGGKTLFVGNLSFSVELEDVEDFFKAAGEVVNIRFGMNADETFKGYGYVEFASVESAEKAFRELNGKELLRRRVRLDYAKERGTFTPYSGQDTSFRKDGKAQGQTVFVRGFNNADCEDEIRRCLEEHFGSCGEISRVSVPKNQDGSGRGIAYIEFKDRDASNRALALNGSEFRECTLLVKEAISRGDARDIAGSGRGYGRNGGRHSWQGSSGRNGWCKFGGRSDWRDFSGRHNFGGRNNCQNFSGRSGVYEGGGGRGDWRDFSGRRGVREGGGGRGDWRGFIGRRGVGDGGGGRGDSRGLIGRRGVDDGGGGRGEWREFSGRRGEWQDFGGRRGRFGGGIGGRGVWQDFGGRRGWFGGGISGRGGVGNNYFNGRRGGVWFGGGGRGSGQGTPIEPCIAATAEDGNNAPSNNEEHVEDQMK